ncbi:MAG TPA: DsrE family protein [Desulfovibrio sp.]|uniref:DsrE family protein n=1 Tax=Desulfovibrio sp. TaxID=885 RepID=UPI002D4D671D|nr:DsrE family protein [Desulfovibrio sp.]HZF62173.1 DsrE family protein [Desulfovibrio sp.]
MSKKYLHILWVNDNPVTAENMVFMYATNSLLKGWWDEVHLILWGATVKLICDDVKLQGLLKKFHDAGGHVSACRKCAENLGLFEQLEKLEGVDEVFYIGEAFTKILKDDEKLITI